MAISLIQDFDQLLSHVATLPRRRVVVVNPSNVETFAAVTESLNKLNVEFDLVGEREVILRGLQNSGANRDRIRLHEHNDVHSALQFSIALVRNGEGQILMKGSVDTGSMMKAVLSEERGLRTGRLLTDIFIMEYPQRAGNKFVMITDGGMTLSPDLTNKIELVKNAVEVAHALGNANPKVAILSATEFVLPNLPSTLDAAALSKMNERGQIRGCIIDGPLALDNALSPEAAEEKGIISPVAGKAEILVAANIESANSLAKSTTYFANMRLAHVIVGARIPILIPSRADKSDAKLLSVALGIIMSCAAS
jgi:phosphate butyryltransferase